MARRIAIASSSEADFCLRFTPYVYVLHRRDKLVTTEKITPAYVFYDFIVALLLVATIVVVVIVVLYV